LTRTADHTLKKANRGRNAIYVPVSEELRMLVSRQGGGAYLRPPMSESFMAYDLVMVML